MNVPSSPAIRRLLPPGLAVLMLGLTAVGNAQTPAPEHGRSAPTTTMTTHSAFGELAPLSDSGVVGVVEFTLGPDGMSIAGQVEGLTPCCTWHPRPRDR